METPLADRLLDAQQDVEDATNMFMAHKEQLFEQQDFGYYTVRRTAATVYDVANVHEAGISLGRAVQKLIAILCEEAPEPQED